MLRDSKNLQKLQHISFDSNKLSEFKIKEQPEDYCLSTIESTLCVLEILNSLDLENIDINDLDKFLNPFKNMVDYQLGCVTNQPTNSVRYKKKHKIVN